MKDSQRKDIETSFMVTNNFNAKQTKEPQKINKWFPGQSLCDVLDGDWTPCPLGAELRLKSDTSIATATISKNRATHMYEYSLRLDASSVGKGKSIEKLEECVKSLSSDIKSVVDVCAELNATLSKSNLELSNEESP